MLSVEEYQKAYEREREARKLAERLLNAKSREVYDNLQQIKTQNKQLEIKTNELECSYQQLKEAHEDIQKTHQQLVQSEKMASLGQIAAGVAHEINNPLAFVLSNIQILGDYFEVIVSIIEKYQLTNERVLDSCDGTCANGVDSALLLTDFVEQIKDIKNIEQEKNLSFLFSDIPAMLEESSIGLLRVKDIVTNLKRFAHSGGEGFDVFDVNECLDTTLKVTWNELKYSINVVRDYGDIPQVVCSIGKLGQVFMNLILNARDACNKEGELVIKTYQEDEFVVISFQDNGEGIPKEKLKRIFDPFFTTKPVGKGTGLGLSVSYRIVQEHKGRLEVDSVENEGTIFRVYLPINQ